MQVTVKHALVCAILLIMPVRSAAPSHAQRQAPASRLTGNPQVRAALDWFGHNHSWINDEQARLTEIPAPPYQEQQRAAAVKELMAEAGLAVQVDEMGNVIGELRGADEKEIILVSAHLDTVFPAGTNVKVRHEGNRMMAPGISDNGTGLAALLALARAMQFARLKTQRTILFAGNVGEEGEGNLRGMRELIEAYRSKLKAVVVLDGSGTDHVTKRRSPALVGIAGRTSVCQIHQCAGPRLRSLQQYKSAGQSAHLVQHRPDRRRYIGQFRAARSTH